MKRKNGFTLIELLAVIVILAIVAIIASPVIIGVIEDSREASNELSEDFYMSAVEQAIAVENLKSGFNPATCEVQDDGNLFCDSKVALEIKISGQKPVGGIINISNGKILSANLFYGELPICRAVNGSQLTTGNSLPYTGYNIGDEYICEVKKGAKYHFFVLSTNTNSNGDIVSVNLILNSNMTAAGVPITDVNPSNTSLLAWIEQNDYANNDGWGTSGNNNKGPLTAMNFIRNATSDWDEILLITDYYDDEGGHFTDFNISSHARLPKYDELTATGCLPGEGEKLETCPLWLVDYMSHEYGGYNGTTDAGTRSRANGIYGYWTFSSYQPDTSRAWYVHCAGYIRNSTAKTNSHRGVRPVITVPVAEIAY